MAHDDPSNFDATPITSPLGGGGADTAGPGPSRRTTIAYYATAARRSFRDTFSRQQLIDAFKAFLWVAPLTILIWIYAEREQLTTQKNFPIPIEIRSADPRQVITVTRPADGTLTADMIGPRAQLDRVREEFGRRSDARARIELGSVPPGPRQIEADAVADDGRFSGNGVMLNNLQPRVLEVFVDVLDDVDVPVRLPPGVTNIANPVFDPPTVRLTAPRSAIEAAAKPLVALVDPASLQQVKTPGQQTVKGVRLTPPIRDPNSRLSVASVNASFEVRQADVQTTLSSIPVWVTFAPGLEQRYRVEYEPSLANVTVFGPADQIRAIEAGTATPRPKATFEVSRENLVSGDAAQKARVKYDLPEGVEVKAEDAQRTIDFRLVERSAVE